MNLFFKIILLGFLIGAVCFILTYIGYFMKLLWDSAISDEQNKANERRRVKGWLLECEEIDKGIYLGELKKENEIEDDPKYFHIPFENPPNN